MALVARIRAVLNGSVAGKILGASALVAGLSALARVAAVARDLILAAMFGLGSTLDAFFMALMIYQFAIGVFLVSFNGAFMPTYVAVREREGAAPADHLLRGVAGLGAVILLAVTVVVAVGAPLYLPLLASGFDAAALRTTTEVTWLLAPFLLFSGAVTLWGAVINAGQKFALPALSPALSAGVSVAVLLLFGRTWGVAALAAGMALGALAEAALLAWTVRRRGRPLAPSFRAAHPGRTVVLREYWATVAGAAMMTSTILVDQAMASWLGPAQVSALALGAKVIGFVLMLAATSLSTAAIPYASELAAMGDSSQLRALADRFLKGIMLLGAVAVAVLWFTAEPVVRLVFQRGAFDAADTALVAQVHAAYALQLPFYVMNVLLLRLLAAVRANDQIMYGAALNLGAKVLLNLVLMEPYGVVGLAYATSAVYALSCAFLYWRLRVKTRPSPARG